MSIKFKCIDGEKVISKSDCPKCFVSLSDFIQQFQDEASLEVDLTFLNAKTCMVIEAFDYVKEIFRSSDISKFYKEACKDMEITFDILNFFGFKIPSKDALPPKPNVIPVEDMLWKLKKVDENMKAPLRYIEHLVKNSEDLIKDPIHYYASVGEYVFLKELLEAKPERKKDNSVKHLAAWYGQEECLHLLQMDGCQFSKSLYLIAIAAGNKNALEVIIGDHLEEYYKEPLLQWAVIFDRVDIVDFLLKKGFKEPTEIDIEEELTAPALEMRPLTLAMNNGRYECLTRLFAESKQIKGQWTCAAMYIPMRNYRYWECVAFIHENNGPPLHAANLILLFKYAILFNDTRALEYYSSMDLSSFSKQILQIFWGTVSAIPRKSETDFIKVKIKEEDCLRCLKYFGSNGVKMNVFTLSAIIPCIEHDFVECFKYLWDPARITFIEATKGLEIILINDSVKCFEVLYPSFTSVFISKMLSGDIKVLPRCKEYIMAHPKS